MRYGKTLAVMMTLVLIILWSIQVDAKDHRKKDPAFVPQTGQTGANYPGDDGDLQKEVPKPEPRNTDNEDGTVLLAGIAGASTLYVDQVGSCDGKAPCYLHPQDAVNAANPGDTITVYPGIYGSRVFRDTPPHYSANDKNAPALIVYKDELTIQAIDPDLSKTVIQTTHDYWSNPVAIQASTGGAWNGSAYIGAGVNPAYGAAPNAVTIIASNVIISGFTLRKPYMNVDWSGFYNTAGVMIGGLYAGDPFHLGVGDNTVTKCVFKDVWNAIYIWHSSDNTILNNTVEALGFTGHWAAISIYDGYTQDQINLGYSSQYNKIINNTIADKGISVGAWATPIWTDNTGTKVHGNQLPYGVLGTHYSSGPKLFSGNVVAGYWVMEASDYKFPGKSNHHMH